MGWSVSAAAAAAAAASLSLSHSLFLITSTGHSQAQPPKQSMHSDMSLFACQQLTWPERLIHIYLLANESGACTCRTTSPLDTGKACAMVSTHFHVKNGSANCEQRCNMHHDSVGGKGHASSCTNKKKGSIQKAALKARKLALPPQLHRQLVCVLIFSCCPAACAVANSECPANLSAASLAAANVL
eukprot:1160013-Pelagomonas_calceolata.AAC.3